MIILEKLQTLMKLYVAKTLRRIKIASEAKRTEYNIPDNQKKEFNFYFDKRDRFDPSDEIRNGLDRAIKEIFIKYKK